MEKNIFHIKSFSKKPAPLDIAIVGATGLVGRELLSLLETSPLPISSLSLFASDTSKGKEIFFRKKKILVDSLTKKSLEKKDLIFFATKRKISQKFIPFAAKTKAICIDSSSFFRMNKNVPLIIPEINPHLIEQTQNIFSSPNCTTTLMLLPLFPLHQAFTIRRIVACTYQSASGGGKKLMDLLKKDTQKYLISNAFPSYPSYGFNLFLHDSPIEDNDYNKEEMKMVKETRKILSNDKIKISATCVRVPIFRVHSISVNVEFEKNICLFQAKNLLKNMSGITFFDGKQFPTPKLAERKKNVFVGRLRKDISQENTLELWIVGDQLLKGAALNALQIAEKLFFAKKR